MQTEWTISQPRLQSDSLANASLQLPPNDALITSGSLQTLPLTSSTAARPAIEQQAHTREKTMTSHDQKHVYLNHTNGLSGM